MVLIERMWFGTSIEYLGAGDWVRWTPGYYPGNAKNTSFSWSTDKPHVVSVDQTGKVQSNYNWDGPATITARAKDGGGAWASYVVDVQYTYVNQVWISEPNLSLKVGKGWIFAWNYGPDNASYPHFQWSSSNPSVATVSGGTVWAHKAGTATITLSALDGSGKSASCKVTVTGSTSSGNNNNKVESISLNKSSVSLVKGKTTTLTATVKNAKNKTVTWSSSNTSVATVSGSGIVKGVKAGTTTITAKSKGGKTVTCKVTVTKRIPKKGQAWYYDLALDNGISFEYSDDIKRIYYNKILGVFGETLAEQTILLGYYYSSDYNANLTLGYDGSMTYETPGDSGMIATSSWEDGPAIGVYSTTEYKGAKYKLTGIRTAKVIEDRVIFAISTPEKNGLPSVTLQTEIKIYGALKAEVAAVGLVVYYLPSVIVSIPPAFDLLTQIGRELGKLPS